MDFTLASTPIRLVVPILITRVFVLALLLSALEAMAIALIEASRPEGRRGARLPKARRTRAAARR